MMYRVLIVDGSLTVRMDLAEACEEAGFEAIPCGTLEAARQALAHAPIQLVLVDLWLPDGEGTTLLAEMRRSPATADVPVMLLSSESEVSAWLSPGVGPDACVGKPYDADFVMKRARALLERQDRASADLSSGEFSTGEDIPVGQTVLAVDDSEVFLQRLAEELRDDAYHVLLARSGEEALEVLGAQRPDCILLDLLMPGLSGLETCRLIKANPDWRRLPLLMLTAVDDEAVMIEGLNAGADDFVAKSAEFAVLKGRLRAQLRRKHYEDEYRRIHEELVRKRIEAGEAEVARELAEARAAILYKEKAAAEAASQAKSQFLATMSHEIRTPLNGIMGMTTLALESEPSQELRTYLDLIRSSAEALHGIIEDILDFSRIEADKLRLESVEFDLHDAVGSTLRMVAANAHRKGLELACRMRSGVPRRVIGDSLRVGQVLTNLVGNAIKFTSAGEVEVEVWTEPEEGGLVQAHFSVRDTGIGIPQEKQDVIFESFTQADASTTRTFGGTGLGLAISSSLAQKMGGSLEVQSVEGEGSVFHFCVPLALPEVRLEAPPEHVLEPGQSVLIVDDNAMFRSHVAEMMAVPGVRVVTASTGEEGVAMVQRARAEGSPFRLVVVDTCLGDTDGLGVVSLLRGGSGVAAETAVLVMATTTDVAHVAPRLREWRIHYVLKPFLAQDLWKVVRLSLRADEGEGERETPSAGTEALRALRILLAEDNPVNQMAVARYLEMQGHQVRVAENGREAVRAFRAAPCDVVLMDVHMPGMDGWEATRAIRAGELAQGTRRVPIIALTASTTSEDVERCREAGMDSFVAKPLDPVRLLSVLQGLLPKVADDGPRGCEPAYRSLLGDLPRLYADEDPEMLRVCARAFCEGAMESRVTLVEALRQGNAPALQTAVQRLRGSLSLFRSPEALDSSLRLEEVAREGNLAQAPDALHALERALEGLLQGLAPLLDEPLEQDIGSTA